MSLRMVQIKYTVQLHYLQQLIFCFLFFVLQYFILLYWLALLCKWNKLVCKTEHTGFSIFFRWQIRCNNRLFSLHASKLSFQLLIHIIHYLVFCITLTMLTSNNAPINFQRDVGCFVNKNPCFKLIIFMLQYLVIQK